MNTIPLFDLEYTPVPSPEVDLVTSISYDSDELIAGILQLHVPINKRFSVYPTEFALHQFYVDAMKEFYRVLKPDGILIFKCQDKVSSSKQYMTHCFIYNEAIKLGYYPKDLFILLAKSRIVADWQKVNQQNARKYHSYFWVFQKCDKVIKYTE